MRIDGALEKAGFEVLTTTQEENATMWEGRVWYNSTENVFKFYNGSTVVISSADPLTSFTSSSTPLTLDSGEHFFSDFTLSSGHSLNIVGNGDPVIINVLGDLNITGTINYNNVGLYKDARFLRKLINGNSLDVSVTRNAGGAGGAGGTYGFGGGGGGGTVRTGGTLQGTGGVGGSGDGGDGGAVTSSTGGAGTPGSGWDYYNVQRAASVIDPDSAFCTVGTVGSGAGGNGGNGAGGGGAGSCNGGTATVLGGGGGGGGRYLSAHGGVVVFVVYGDISGSGTINIYGENVSSIPAAQGKNGGAGNCTSSTDGAAGGGGGGGGASGGSGGHFVCQYNGSSNTQTWTINKNGGAGGSGGSGAAGDTSGGGGPAAGSGGNGSTGSTGNNGTSSIASF